MNNTQHQVIVDDYAHTLDLMYENMTWMLGTKDYWMDGRHDATLEALLSIVKTKGKWLKNYTKEYDANI